MTQVDPMATKYASLTPYNYSFNDPVTFTDVNGADPSNGCTNCEPIFQPYTGFQYNNSYDGFVQDDVIYYRQSGWTGPVYRYAGSALYMDQNVAPGGSGSWSMQLMMSFAEDARRTGGVRQFLSMFSTNFGGGINGLTDGLASLGLSLVPNKPPEPPIRPAIDPTKVIAGIKGGNISADDPDQVALNQYKERTVTFSATKYDTFVTEGMLPFAGTFYVKGSYSVRKIDNKYVISAGVFSKVLANGSGNVTFSGRMKLYRDREFIGHVDFGMIPQKNEQVSGGSNRRLRVSKDYSALGGASMDLPTTGNITVELEFSYHIVFSSVAQSHSSPLLLFFIVHQNLRDGWIPN